MINEVFTVAKRVDNDRTVDDVFKHIVSEVGELSDEIAIKYGISKEAPGKDGVFGEAVDILAATIDLIFVDNPNVTEEEILSYLSEKLNKWERKASNDD